MTVPSNLRKELARGEGTRRVYRILIWVAVLAAAAAAGSAAVFGLCPACQIGVPGVPPFLARSDIGLALWYFASNAVMAGVVLLLVRGAAFAPGKRTPAPLAALRLAGGATALLLALAILYAKAAPAGLAAAVLAGQSKQAPLLILGADQGLHSLPEWLGLALVLTAPLFWLVRGIQVRSLTRASFEAWVEARRRIGLALALLALAALIEVFLSPAVAAWVLALDMHSQPMVM